jgi:hypothetical protein
MDRRPDRRASSSEVRTPIVPAAPVMILARRERAARIPTGVTAPLARGRCPDTNIRVPPAPGSASAWSRSAESTGYARRREMEAASDDLERPGCRDYRARQFAACQNRWKAHLLPRPGRCLAIRSGEGNSPEISSIHPASRWSPLAIKSRRWPIDVKQSRKMDRACTGRAKSAELAQRPRRSGAISVRPG